MSEAPPARLLAGNEPSPVIVERERGTSPFFFACDHAGKLMPHRLGTLGLPTAEIERHIGWDIGILGVSRLLAETLDATLIGQIYSRLVIDCNRDPSVASSICEVSELTAIPGNVGLAAEERLLRQTELFRPYHERMARELDARRQRGQPTVLVSMHSFTPVFKGFVRPWHVGMLYNRDARLGRILLDLLGREGDLVVGDNEPYAVSDASDYTIPVHGERRGIPSVEIEIRQDLIAGEAGQRAWAERLARLLPQALSRLETAQSPA